MLMKEDIRVYTLVFGGREKGFTIYYLLFTIYCLPFTIYCLPFTVYYSFTILVNWEEGSGSVSLKRSFQVTLLKTHEIRFVE